MSRTVKLVTLQKVCPPLIPVFYGKVCIQVAVLVLGGGNNVNKGIGSLFKLSVGKHRKDVPNRFKPFSRVAVLKDHAVKTVASVLSAQCRGRVYEILYNVALLRPLRFVAENIVLIGNNNVLDKPLVPHDKAFGGLVLLYRYLPLGLPDSLSFHEKFLP